LDDGGWIRPESKRMGMLHILGSANRYRVMSLSSDAHGRGTWFTAVAQNPLLT
jgi:hypothetical protein